MNCDCTEKISLLIDGELKPAEARELEVHLLDCVECQEARADFLNLRNQITDFPLAFDPSSQREALARIVGKRRSASVGADGVWGFNPAFAAVASLLIVGAVIAFLLYPRLNRAGNSGSK
jgi:anti-sigma factor RsiW